jgi:hypothetical protein
MMARAFCVNQADNVATMLDEMKTPEAVRILGAAGAVEMKSLDPIALGHKIALRDIPSGQPIVKFGVQIGRASRDIHAGQWVHLHNCESNFDERSQTLDLHTGAATDTKYE